MLLLSRKSLQTLILGSNEGSNRQVKVTVLEIKNGKVKLGSEAPDDVRIHRCELVEPQETDARRAASPKLPGRTPTW